MWTLASSHDTKLPLRQIFSVVCMVGRVLSVAALRRDGTGRVGSPAANRIRFVTDVDPRRARSFGGVAGAYRRARPSYPPAAVRWVLDWAPGPRVVDLAAGTGKLTEVLRAEGADVVAVEPLDRMREELRAAVPGVAALAGAAEAIPLPDASADAVTVAQAFHWFRTDEALTEIGRVLVPAGVVGLLRHMRDDGVGRVRAPTEPLGR